MRRRAGRLERGGRLTLAVASALALAGFALAGIAGRPDSPWLNLAAVTPVLGGLLGLARVAVLRPPRGRATVGYLLICLALLGWGGSGAWPLLAALRQAAPPAMPSLGDVGYYAGGLLWTSAVWVIAEGVVPEQVAALTFPLLSGFNALMLFRLSRRRQGARLRTGQTAIKLLAAGLGLVYLAQMTLETMTILDARTRGTPAVVRPALLPAIGYALAFGLLVFGVARFPLTTPVVSDHPPDPAKPSPG